MDVLLIIIGIILTITGIVGCIIPAVPGPPLNYLSIILIELIVPEAFSSNFLIIFAVLTIFVSVLDYVLPVWGAKLFGVSKYGIWGSFLGMIIGIIFFPPVGMILGLIIGAVTGEMLAGKDDSEILKAGFASFILSISMIILKFSLSAIMAFYFFKEVVVYII